jgi:hypothetical protein
MGEESWEGFNPLGVNRGTFVLFHGYIDESYGPAQNVFALSCLIAKRSDWFEFQRKWKLHLAAKNRALAKAGRTAISRYHATDCSGRRKEYKGWSHDERDEFVCGLFQIFRQISTFTVVYDVRIDDVCSVFPEYATDRLRATYFWLTTFMLIQIGKDFVKMSNNRVPLRFTLFHDRTAGNGKDVGKYDPTILEAFNRLKNDKTFSNREKFTTIAPLSWEGCIALQPADLVAFECYKQAEFRLKQEGSRKAFNALMDMETFGIHSKTVTVEALEKLRTIVMAAREKRDKAANQSSI